MSADHKDDEAFIPSTFSIRIAYAYVDEASPELYAQRFAAFDRWLAAHDAAIRAGAR